jgi:hypothetical protein
MAVTAAQLGRQSRCVVFKQGTSGQSAGETNSTLSVEKERSLFAHSTGITISLARTMFKRLRAAASMVRGLVLSCSISLRKDWLVLRSPSTSVCIRRYCCDASVILVLVRIVTATHIARVAKRIMAKITQAGITPPRLRTSAGVPMMSSEISLTDANGTATRGVTRCARIRSSTQ